MGRGSSWSWFDVNRSTFDEDVREKLDFYIFVPTLTFRPQNLLPQLLLSGAMFPPASCLLACCCPSMNDEDAVLARKQTDGENHSEELCQLSAMIKQ